MTPEVSLLQDMSRPLASLAVLSEQSNMSTIQQKLNKELILKMSQMVVQSKQPHRSKIPQELKSLYCLVSHSNSVAQVITILAKFKADIPKSNCEAVRMKQN